jgi:hypothetical protein
MRGRAAAGRGRVVVEQLPRALHAVPRVRVPRAAVRAAAPLAGRARAHLGEREQVQFPAPHALPQRLRPAPAPVPGSVTLTPPASAARR